MSKIIEHLEKIVDQNHEKLRDHFAGLAMQGILSAEVSKRSSGNDYLNQMKNPTWIAKEAYLIADAMLIARKED